MNQCQVSASQAQVIDDDYDKHLLSARQIGSKIASTRSSDIHAISKHEVIKIHHPNIPLEDIERSARVSFAVHQAGIPVPRSHARPVKIFDGRFGIIFERLQGPLLGDLMLRQPAKIAHFARTLAEQHKIVHSASDIAGLRLQSDVLAEKIEKLDCLREDEKRKLLQLLETLPNGSTLCHGDFHCENVISNGPGFTFIDWGDSTLGNPLGDVARAWLIMRFVTAHGWKSRIYCWLFSSLYARAYLKDLSWSQNEFSAWKVVQAAARLAESVPESEISLLLRFVRSSLKKLPDPSNTVKNVIS